MAAGLLALTVLSHARVPGRCVFMCCLAVRIVAQFDPLLPPIKFVRTRSPRKDHRRRHTLPGTVAVGRGEASFDRAWRV